MGRGGARPNEAPTSKSRSWCCSYFYISQGRRSSLLAGRLGSRRLRGSETLFETQKYEQRPAAFLFGFLIVDQK